MPNTPDTHYLTGAHYLPERKEVAAEFRSPAGGRVIERFKFFPSFYLGTGGIEPSLLEEVLSLYDGRRFMCRGIAPGRLQVTASAYADLRKIANLLSSSLMLNLSVPEPERQFLLQNGWSYFDAFEKAQEKFRKIPPPSLPAVQPDFLALPLQEALRELMLSDAQGAELLAKRIALSNILCTRPQNLPNGTSAMLDLMLENLFFSCALPAPTGSAFPRNRTENCACAEKENPIPHENRPAEPYFHCALPLPDAEFLLNLGQETMNCGCCRPETLSAENISPTALVNVLFNSDGIFFESAYTRWAEEFHNSNPERERRERWRMEWSLPSIPAGPFFRGQAAMVPFADLQMLTEKGCVSVLPHGHELSWFCTKHESAISRQIRESNERVSLLGAMVAEREKTHLKSHKILFASALGQDAEHLYLSNLNSSLSELISLMPAHLANPNSRFYSRQLADAISCIRQGMVRNARVIGSEQAPVLSPAGKGAGIMLLLTRQFSLSARG
ncbi:MAG: hypothetical protein V1676_01405 [Candidatus Diapherotrites archaeon]